MALPAVPAPDPAQGLVPAQIQAAHEAMSLYPASLDAQIELFGVAASPPTIAAGIAAVRPLVAPVAPAGHHVHIETSAR
jgi:hypothetical protein